MVPHEPSSAPVPFFQGDLAQTPLPEILVKIHRHRVPGAIECRRDDTGELKQIYLDGGLILFATSNRVEDSLGDKLLREGTITRAQYDESVRLLRETGKRQGVILAEMRAVEPRDLFVALREQIQEIVWSVFAWQSGTVAFAPGRDKQREFVKLEIPTLQAVLQGVRRMPDARALVARLGSKTTVFARTNDVADVTLDADEQRLLNAVNGRRSLFELVSTEPLPAADNARILYAFSALGIIEVAPSRPIKVQVKAR
ncbi:MAG TPA: DUF4388 domain-containing protein [Thermoanaerobaculia bacterium]|nr:DUF4388 domain-containing protein [Thermoanaerobaculia bacterium]